MNRNYRRILSTLLIVSIIIITSSCGAPSGSGWYKSDCVYITDMPSGDQLFFSLKNKIHGDPMKCYFGAEETQDEIINIMESELNRTIQVSKFISSDGVTGCLLEITGEHTVFQDFYATGRKYYDSDLMEYEFQGCDVMLVTKNNIEKEYAIMFPLVILDKPYSRDAFYAESIVSGERYKLIETDSEGMKVDYIELLEHFYSKLDCYKVNSKSQNELVIASNDNIIKSLYRDNSPADTFLIGIFSIKIEDGTISITYL